MIYYVYSMYIVCIYFVYIYIYIYTGLVRFVGRHLLKRRHQGLIPLVKNPLEMQLLTD